MLELVSKKVLEKQSEQVKKSIHLVGKIKYSDLKKYFKNANLNIGVASTISDGASTSLISIPVRHYSYNCEGYGFLPESLKFTTSTLPGISIDVFIEKVLNMTLDEYLFFSKKSHECFYIDAEEIDSRYYRELNNQNVQNRSTISIFIYIYIYIYNLLRGWVKNIYVKYLSKTRYV